jgi:acetylornithine deacetylase
MGLAPGEVPEAARRAMAEALAATADEDPWLRDHPPELTWWGGRFLAARTAEDHPLVGAVRTAAEAVLGRRPALEGVTYGADLGLLTEVGGTPGVLFGPGDIRRAHRPDEWVSVDDLVSTARALAVAIVRFCV